MARVDPNTTLGGVRGSVAGMVVSSGLSGWYARTAITPLRSRSQLQATQRWYLAAVAARWKALPPASRSAWATAAALPAWQRTDWFGVPYSMGGYGLFVSLNLPLAMLSRPLVDSPPAADFPDPVAITSATLYRDGSNVNADVYFDEPLDMSGPFYRIWLAVAALGSSSPLASRRILDVIYPSSHSYISGFWSRASSIFGLPLVGQRWTVFVATFDSFGRSSPVSSISVTCTETP